jgi:hypothetical protein
VTLISYEEGLTGGSDLINESRRSGGEDQARTITECSELFQDSALRTSMDPTVLIGTYPFKEREET